MSNTLQDVCRAAGRAASRVVFRAALQGGEAAERSVAIASPGAPSAVPHTALAAVLTVAVAASGALWATPLRADEPAPMPERMEPADDVTHDERWETLRAYYFADAAIASGEALLSLDAPERAHDAAVVPVAVHALDPDVAIRRVHLIVDKNPLPLAGIFTFEEDARGWRTLETRIRIDEYTNVRAVAELDDGSLAMVSRFVKAAGGCSAPAMADLDAAMARAGKMKLLIDEATANATPAVEGMSPAANVSGGSPALASATIKISHPNSSGMQFDQVSRNYVPAFFVQRIDATVEGRPLIGVETNFSLSENPVIALTFPESAARGTLAVHASDSKGNRYESSAPFVDGGS